MNTIRLFFSRRSAAMVAVSVCALLGSLSQAVAQPALPYGPPDMPPQPAMSAWPPPSPVTTSVPPSPAVLGPAPGSMGSITPAVSPAMSTLTSPAPMAVPPAGATPSWRSATYGVPADGRTTCPPGYEPRLTESTWYARIDYYHWNERIGGADFVNEDGPFYTLGYVRRSGRERFRAELFGGSVHYAADITYDDGSSEPLSSHTNYLGVRAEYDLLFEPKAWPINFFIGLGTRLWIRDLPDDVTRSGTFIGGYQETWWTFYPYLGFESRRDREAAIEFFYGGRIGFTALTYEHVTFNDAVLWPRMGLMGTLEAGLRGRSAFLSAYIEAMSWEQSHIVRDSLQPKSTLVTLGARVGFTF